MASHYCSGIPQGPEMSNSVICATLRNCHVTHLRQFWGSLKWRGPSQLASLSSGFATSSPPPLTSWGPRRSRTEKPWFLPVLPGNEHIHSGEQMRMGTLWLTTESAFQQVWLWLIHLVDVEYNWRGGNINGEQVCHRHYHSHLFLSDLLRGLIPSALHICNWSWGRLKLALFPNYSQTLIFSRQGKHTSLAGQERPILSLLCHFWFSVER